jgi:hypothetical protein
MEDDRIHGDSPEEEALFLSLEELGEAEVRAKLTTARFTSSKQGALKWLNLIEAKREKHAADLARRSVVATESAAISAKQSADAAKLSARYAVWAVIISIVALAVSLVK